MLRVLLSRISTRDNPEFRRFFTIAFFETSSFPVLDVAGMETFLTDAIPPSFNMLIGSFRISWPWLATDPPPESVSVFAPTLISPPVRVSVEPVETSTFESTL